MKIRNLSLFIFGLILISFTTGCQSSETNPNKLEKRPTQVEQSKEYQIPNNRLNMEDYDFDKNKAKRKANEK
jgi:hypothetical protein